MRPMSATHGSSHGPSSLPTDPLVALRAGDPAPFEAFVRARARTLVAYFLQQGAAPARAEDLTQEVFLKLYRGAARYRPEERFVAYCFRVARNVWIDDCRRAARALGAEPSEGLESEAPGPWPDPGAGLVLAEEEQGLRALLDELPHPHRRVVELVFLGQLSYVEIGALLSIPVGTVKSRMFHALRRLRRAWERKRQREGVA